MNKILQHKYWWIAILLLFPAITYVSSLFRYRIDLTAEKRFSLTQPTKELLHNLDSTIDIQVFLTGDLPADYKKLSIATQDLLNEFRDLSNNRIQVHYENPGEGLDDTSKAYLYDSLSSLGVVFDQTQDVSSANDKATKQLIIPSALVTYGNRKPFAIDLRSSRKVYKNFNVVNDIPQEDKEATLNAAEALLEFKFANAVDKLTRKYVPVVVYTIGNGEPLPLRDPRVNDIGKSLENEYRLGIFDLKQGYPDPQQIDALLIVKPTQPFTDEDKLKIDQYVMHGGKVVWCIDKLYAELDSLMRSQSDFVAFDRNLNVDDILFKYGVRINGDLLQDLNCAKIPIVVGQNPDGSPQMQRFPWPYYPFVSTTNNNPISKNLDRVLPIFPSSIDTVSAPGIQKTILLASDTNSRRLSSPAIVSLNSIKDDAEFQSFNKSYIPVAVLLEGNFTSLYANRLTKDIQDSVTRALGKPFARASEKPTKQIVMSDADIVTNTVSQSTGPLSMGEIPFENYRFANREFFLNCIDYLVSNNGIFQARNKDFTLRLLDKKKTEDQRSMWQLINIAVPIVVILLFGALYQWRRKQKFSV
ncbi:gliding motility-associated ABC transporter substrate-binding protein GldG [Panacibacter ginsenosidivorans]|uniref:Gliding motility-associated ABC transporter substrate-binding protein GldG n=1 Tax=Panacibacter ginsenosidivorans TaxID=1813871 RepID=A0A5B8VC17_9BACT|nr:gliding motility-associated ABC transporter substrate-binding protein GldG [Panacibacter ginsenosidivorans]QEC68226.1 gliding motility-associated ABC transporter substrate-binding protein GldG [Panacibacter ginsenosidivorans]